MLVQCTYLDFDPPDALGERDAPPLALPPALPAEALVDECFYVPVVRITIQLCPI